MKLNEYSKIDEFIEEYAEGRAPSTVNACRKYMGIEFKYKEDYYRMCREPMGGGLTSSESQYRLMLMCCNRFGYPIADEFRLIGNYINITDLLENGKIGDEYFSNIIIDDNTEILSKD